MGVIERGKGWEMYSGDCLGVVRAMAAGSIGHVITDPPYATTSGSSSFVSTKGVSLPRETQFFEAWIREHLSEWRRVLSASGAAWFTIDWRGAMTVDEACSKLAIKSPVVGVWDRGGLGMGHLLRHVYECFCVVTMAEFQRTRCDEPDVWHIDWFPSSRSGDHSAEKPVALFERAIALVSSCEEEIILDPFAGSGTTGVACLRLGRKFIGIEKDPTYFALACERLRAEEQGSTLQASRAGQLSLLGGK